MPAHHINAYSHFCFLRLRGLGAFISSPTKVNKTERKLLVNARLRNEFSQIESLQEEQMSKKKGYLIALKFSNHTLTSSDVRSDGHVQFKPFMTEEL